MATSEQQSNMWTIRGASLQLGLSETTIRRMVKKKEITSYQAKGRIFIERKDLNKYKAGMRVQAVKARTNEPPGEKAGPLEAK